MIRIKRLLSKRMNHGFTLVEMIVSIALLAILLGGMVLFIAPVLSSYTNNQALYTAENVASCVEEQITHTLRNAYQVHIITNCNYTLNADSSVKSLITPMAAYVSGKNGDAIISANREYELRCMSLRYYNGQYFLCNEIVSENGNGDGGYINDNKENDKLKDHTKAFSNVIYNNLYMDYDFKMPTETLADGTTAISADTLEYAIKAYTDKDKKNVVFNGKGMSEMYAIKVMRRSGGSTTDYYCKVTNLPEVEGNNDIYIYYVARKLKGVTGS